MKLSKRWRRFAKEKKLGGRKDQGCKDEKM